MLDNGSSDDTPLRLQAFCDRLGPERFSVVELPVNVGAAAARNWLMALPEAAASEHIVYMDDDVRLPLDWLGRLGACAEDYPEAGAWGCRVVDEGNPAVLQSVDTALTDPDPSPEEDSRRFKISDLHHQNLDFGQFSYTRPCASVTGCCHMFRYSRLEEAGGLICVFLPPSTTTSTTTSDCVWRGVPRPTRATCGSNTASARASPATGTTANSQCPGQHAQAATEVWRRGGRGRAGSRSQGAPGRPVG